MAAEDRRATSSQQRLPRAHLRQKDRRGRVGRQDREARRSDPAVSLCLRGQETHKHTTLMSQSIKCWHSWDPDSLQQGQHDGGKFVRHEQPGPLTRFEDTINQLTIDDNNSAAHFGLGRNFIIRHTLPFLFHEVIEGSCLGMPGEKAEFGVSIQQLSGEHLFLQIGQQEQAREAVREVSSKLGHRDGLGRETSGNT